MDWFSWLTKTGLDPFTVYNYALTFNCNELKEDDIPYISHELLQTMGVSVAKHRLEILKLAQNKKCKCIDPSTWFADALATIKKTTKHLAEHIRAKVHRENIRAPLVQKRSQSLRWKVAMLQRSKILGGGNPDRCRRRNIRFEEESAHKSLMPSDGPRVVDPRALDSTKGSRPGNSKDKVMPASPQSRSCFSTHSLYDKYCSSTEEIKWNSMFNNLMPT